jgi:hypothetical protein
MTMTPTGAGMFASTLTGLDTPMRLDRLDASAARLTHNNVSRARDLIRTITFRTGRQEGCVTGIAIGVACEGDIVEGRAEGRMYDGLRVMMTGAGCVYPKPYLIPAGSTVVRIESW